MGVERIIERPQACPFLPTVRERRPAAGLAKFRNQRKGPEFFIAALECAQSRWLEGLPAQALLMLNRALSVEFSEWSSDEREVIDEIPVPYRALAWIVERGDRFGFMGNPRRHFQHLATRMSGENFELRVARAWACWAIVRKARPDFIADEKQVADEGVVEPKIDEVRVELRARVLDAEFAIFEQVFADVRLDRDDDFCGPE